MRVLLLGVLGVLTSGCFAPAMDGEVRVGDSTIYATLTNKGRERLDLLQAECNYGFTFEVLHGDYVARVSFNDWDESADGTTLGKGSIASAKFTI